MSATWTDHEAAYIAARDACGKTLARRYWPTLTDQLSLDALDEEGVPRASSSSSAPVGTTAVAALPELGGDKAARSTPSNRKDTA